MNRPPFVLLHGWACPTATWAPVAQRLRDAGHRVEVPALVGYGDRGATFAEEAWTLEAAADDVARLLTRLGSAAVVAGHSLGGSVAATLAARRPDLVRAVALVGMVPVAPSAATAERLSRLFLSGGELDSPSAEAIESCLAAWYGEAPRDPRWRAELEAPFHVPGPVLRGSLRAALRGVAAEVPDEIEVPAAVVLGAGDSTRPPQEVAAFLRGHPRWAARRIPGAGHMVQWEAPQACAAALLALAEGPQDPTGQ